METVPERIDWLRFLGYDLDTGTPDHSVLSKARKKWGVEAFKKFFERIVWQCVEAGLVGSSKIFMDSSLMEADASNNSVVGTHSLKRYLNKSYKELERRLENRQDKEERAEAASERGGAVNNRFISTTDIDAAIVRQRSKPKLYYKTHRAVDPAYGIITAAEVTAGNINEAHKMVSLIDTHQDNTGHKSETVVADSKYGTVDNFLNRYDSGVRSHIPDLKTMQDNKGTRQVLYGEDKFIYDLAMDMYVCPGGARLKRKSLHERVCKMCDERAMHAQQKRQDNKEASATRIS